MKIKEALFLEYQTKEGQEIDLKYDENVEPKLGPWVVHKIEASVNGKPAGYIKISYIPKENIKKYFPSILNYLASEGKNIFPYNKRYTPYAELSTEELIESFTMLYYYVRGGYPEYRWQTKTYIYNGKPIKKYSRGELLDIFKLFEKEITKDFGKKYKKFKDFHVDHPLVDYINSKIPRQRIGETLYLAGTKWMNSKGMNLYGSGIQSEDAKGIWKYMAAKHNVQTDGRGTYIKI